ncbi:MAG TPA: hypothetical protein VFP97_14960 [Chitinophagaceae bacterium]|nr:hypothetical protein [Chitinophagaceae bacterium]
MKFLLLPFFVLNACWIHAQETPPPSPPVTDSLDQYAKDSVGIFQKVEVKASFAGGLPAW